MRVITMAAAASLALAPGLRGQDPSVILEPDHCSIWVSKDAPEASLLTSFGLLQDQDPEVVRFNGVSWVSFSFENFYLELLWVHDEESFQENWVWWDPLWEQRADWRTTDASPFLLAFHREDPDNLNLPFRIAEDVNFYEDGGWVKHGNPQLPYVFVMGPRDAMPDPWWMTPEIREHAKSHPAGIRKLTGVRVSAPEEETHEAIEVLVSQGALRTGVAGEHLLELTFDDGRQGKTFDARPDLPLIFYY